MVFEVDSIDDVEEDVLAATVAEHQGAITEKQVASAERAQTISNVIGYSIGGVLLIAVAILTNFSIGAWLLFVLLGPSHDQKSAQATGKLLSAQ